jgi:hypothetical protein
MKFFLKKSFISTNIPFLAGRAMVVEKASRYRRNVGRTYENPIFAPRPVDDYFNIVIFNLLQYLPAYGALQAFFLVAVRLL